MHSKGVDAIYTPVPEDSGKDSRPRQTISLAAFYNDLSIFGTAKYFEIDFATNEILGNSFLENKTVLVCWEHTSIQALVKGLTGEKVPFWMSEDFSTVIILQRQGDKYKISFSCEDLLPGDQKECDTYGIKRKQHIQY